MPTSGAKNAERSCRTVGRIIFLSKRRVYYALENKTVLMDEATMMRALMRMAHEITEKNKGVEDVCLVGICRRGEPLARKLQQNIEKIEGVRLACGELDIRFHRDDVDKTEQSPVVSPAKLPFDIVGKKVVLVDDVLFTGRTVRAAIEAIFMLGRPREIQLAILVDRGHRELPIRADYIGKSIPTARSEKVAVKIPPVDAESGVYLFRQQGE